MKCVKVTMSNKDHFSTMINGTEETIKDYYMKNTFNMGNADKDVMCKVEKIEFLRDEYTGKDSLKDGK